MVSDEEKKKQKLLELDFDAYYSAGLTDLLLKNWSTTSKLFRIKHSKEILNNIIIDFYENGWITKPSDLKATIDIGSYLINITRKHYGDRTYEPAVIYKFGFLKPGVKAIKDWKLIQSILELSESPYDLLQTGLKATLETGIIKSPEGLKTVKKIARSSGHNAIAIFTYAIPTLVKYGIIKSLKDLEKVIKTLLELINSVKYAESVLRDLGIFGEKNILRKKSDLELLKDILKMEKDIWKAQKKFYLLLKLVQTGKIKLSLDLKRYKKR